MSMDRYTILNTQKLGLLVEGKESPPPKLSLDNSKQNLGNLTSLLHFHASAFQSFLDCVEQNRILENVLVRIWTMLTTLCMSLSCYVIGQN